MWVKLYYGLYMRKPKLLLEARCIV